jgi:hypothetical protein
MSTKTAPAKSEKTEKTEAPKKKLAPLATVLLTPGQKLLKSVFFYEIDEEQERQANKRKYSSELRQPDRPTVATRHKNDGQETMEQLRARIEAELDAETEEMAEMYAQNCIKCGIRPVSPNFVVDKDLGYCEECAELLHLETPQEQLVPDYQDGPGDEDDDISALMKDDDISVDIDEDDLSPDDE